MKRGYFVSGTDDAAGFAVVAASSMDAKKIAHASGELDAEWIDIRVKWIRGADVGGLPFGMVTDALDALRRGLYGYIEDAECDECGKTATLFCYEGRALCECTGSGARIDHDAWYARNHLNICAVIIKNDVHRHRCI